MLEIWFVRHGETNWNVDRRIQGWTDVPLNPQGQRQAQLLAESLEGMAFRALYSSDLERAISTAVPLSKVLSLPIYTLKSLRERRFGYREGLLQYKTHPGLTTAAMTGLHAQEESRTRLRCRAEGLIRGLQQRHHGRILCVSHGGFIRAVLEVVGAVEVPPLQNTAICRIRHDENGWYPLTFNQCSHLLRLQSQLSLPAEGTEMIQPDTTGPVLQEEYRPGVRLQ